jgi:hypothetical protein
MRPRPIRDPDGADGVADGPHRSSRNPIRAMRGRPIVLIGVRPTSCSTSKAFSTAANNSRPRRGRHPARAFTIPAAFQQELVPIVVVLTAREPPLDRRAGTRPGRHRAGSRLDTRHLRNAQAVESGAAAERRIDECGGGRERHEPAQPGVRLDFEPARAIDAAF